MANKKFIILIGTIVGLIIIGLAVFWIFYARRPAAPAGETAVSFPSGEKIPGGQPYGAETAPQVSPQTVPAIQAGQLKTLIQLTQKPIVGATYISSAGAVRYFEKATGHIYDLNMTDKAASRVSNTTIPGIFEVFFSADANEAILRYTEDDNGKIQKNIRNFSLSGISGTTTPKGIFMLSTIKSFASSPKENKIFYLTLSGGFNIGLTASFEDKNQKQMFFTSFSEFIPDWPAENIITLLSKPSSRAEGYFYRLDPSSGNLEKILGGLNGLTALLSWDGEYAVYSESGYSDFKTSIYTLKDGKISSLNAITLPEKCAWSNLKAGIIYCGVPMTIPQAAYPDDWYQGLVSFSDRVWKIDVLSGETTIISAESETPIDLINPFLGENGDYLFFQNKYDGTLWGLQIDIL